MDENLFDAFDPDHGAAAMPVTPSSPAAQPQQPDSFKPEAAQPNVFDQFDPDKQPEAQTSDVGAFARGAERSALPAAGGLIAAGAGAEAGGAIGALFGGWGAIPGAIAGGVAGAIGGSVAVDKAQHWALQAVPDDWKDKLGLSDRQQQLDEEYHPTASFLGGLAPYVLTMRPGMGAAAALPQNATAWQRILANPMTARVFGGATMGGMEAGNEVAQGQSPNWTNIGISTGFGMIFNKPTRIGESLTELGAHPMRSITGAPEPVAPVAGEQQAAAEAPPEPAAPVGAPVTAKDWNETILGSGTVAQAGDAKVMGPGVTEDVFMGSHQQAPEAAMTAQDAARTEASMIGPQPAAPDLGTIARTREPELFGQYDALSQQRDDLRAHIAALANPTDEAVQAAQEARDALQAKLDEHLSARGGYAGGPEARAMRAQIRDAQGQVDQLNARREAYAAGKGTETPEMAAMRQHLMATDIAMRDLAPQVAAAHRRAADHLGSEVVEPEAPEEAQAPRQIAPNDANSNQIAPHGPNGPIEPAPAGPVPVSTQEQAVAIAAHMEQQLLAAGVSPLEAKLGGELQAQHYIARARRFKGGELGSPLDLYHAQGPIVRGVGRWSTPGSTPPAPIAARKPPLMPTLDEPALPSRTVQQETAAPAQQPAAEPVAAPAAVEPAAQAATPAPAAPIQQPTPAPQGGSGIEALDPRTIGVDAKRFQFKAGGDEAGVTERLQDIKKWDPLLAGTAIVFRDADGKNWVADGHQRLGLAKRLIDAGQNDIKLNAFVLDAADGITDADARATAAYKNIAEGTGSAVDAAKVLHEAKEKGVEAPPLPPRSVLVRDGNALANLSPEAFGAVVNEVVPEAQGAIVGRLLTDPAQQIEAIRLLAALKPDNARQAEMVVRDMMQSGTEQMTQQSLFGDEHFAGSVVIERARIADEAIKQLRKDKATFNTLVKESDRITGAGQNVLDQAANQGRLTTDEKASDLLTQLAFRAGPVSDALSAVARRLKSGDISRAEAARDFLGVVRGAVEEGVDTGQDVGRAEPGAAGERQELATEPGAEGLPQTLIPGVEPITDAQRAQLDAERGLTGGDVAAIAKDYLARNESPDRGSKGPLVEARRAAAKTIAEELQAANFRHGPAEAPDIARVSDGDPELKSILDKVAAQDPDPENWAGLVKNDKALDDALWAWARKDPKRLEGLGPHTDAGTIMDSVLGEHFYQTSLYREFLAKNGVNPTGQDLYKQLGDRLASAPQEEPPGWTQAGTATPGQRTKSGDVLASEALRDAGIPGHQYVGHESRSTNYVIYDDSRVPITNYEQAKRGSITLAPGRKPIIKLFADADSSTLIHESGHQFLEELMLDAVHPAANEGLRNDAQTVADWLGMEEVGGKIKTQQHEKFARGFEQYMREGVAPSPGLARVFAQFKTWLTQIYQTLKGLGSPINEDIKGVFDRLLAEEPNRTVIAPEREGEASLANMHEIDVAQAHPAEAEPITDRVVAERETYVAQQPPEIQNEIAKAEVERARLATPAADLGAEGDAGGAGRGEVGVPSGDANAEPASGSSGGERGAVQPGGSAGVSEGTGVAAGATSGAGAADAGGLRGIGPEPAGAAGSKPQPLAPEPAHVFGPSESPFVDKAGNIRIENLTTNADVAQAIHDSADANNDFIGDRRGVITDGQVLDLADALGMDAKSLSQRKLGQAFNAEQIVAARKLLIQSATDVSAMAKKAATGTDEDVMAYAQAKDRHQMIQAQVAGITAEAGRALRAFRNLTGDNANIDAFIRQATGKTLFQLKEEAKLAATLDTPGQVSKFINDAKRRTFGQMVLEYWINGLISGPATHTTYMVGNTILAMEKAGPETAAAALIGRLRTAMGREGQTVRMGEVGAQFQGMVSALPMATKAAIDSLRTGVTTRLPGETPRSLPFQPSTEFAPAAMIDEATNYANAAPQLFGMVRGLRDGLISAGKLVQAGGVPGAPTLGLRYSPLGAIPDIAVRGVPVIPLGTAARIPSRFVAAIHSFFRATNYSMAKNALAYRAASEAGLTGEAFDARVADARQNPTPEMMDQARYTATQLTLMGQGSEFVQALSKLTNAKILGFPILKFVDPFVHIAGNIIDQSLVQRTPLGILSPELRADLLGKNGTIAQDTAQGRMLVGTALSVAFGTLAAEGLMSGSGPSDPNQSAMWRLAGNQAHSVRIGDTWYAVNRLGPIGMLGGVAADMYDVAHAAQQGDMLQAASLLQHAFTQNVLDESFMSGPSQLIQALEDPGRYGQSYIRNFLSSFVPYSVGMGQMAKASDPYSRQARGLMDAIKNKVPGLSESLMPRRDIWGNEIPNLNAVGGRALSAVYMQPINNDPVNQAMLNLGIYPAAVEKKIRSVLLTDQQYDDYARLAGRMAKMRLDTIVGAPDFRTWSPTTQHDVIVETVRQSRETARGMIMARNPSIVQQALAAKMAPLKKPGG